MGAYKLWIDAVADNISNINTVRGTNQPAFAERFVMVGANAPDGGAGVHVQGAAFGDTEGILAYEPNHPLADENGMVRRPNINLSEQMAYLIEAQRGYQANVAVMDRARAAYESALTIGQ
jgi:flagellar basal-body rod protein FlgC